MAMNKKETELMENLKHELLIAKAFKFTDKIKTDVSPPEHGKELSVGWSINVYSSRVSPSCSSRIYHSTRSQEKTDAQNPISMYSTELLALKALRNGLEIKFATELAAIDKRIEDQLK